MNLDAEEIADDIIYHLGISDGIKLTATPKQRAELLKCIERMVAAGCVFTGGVIMDITGNTDDIDTIREAYARHDGFAEMHELLDDIYEHPQCIDAFFTLAPRED